MQISADRLENGPSPTPAPRRGRGTALVRGVAGTLGPPLLLFLAARTFLVNAFVVPSPSMEPTLQTGDYILANPSVFGARLPFSEKRLPAFRDPRVGEVIVYRPSFNDPPIDMAKRIVAGPGDTVAMVSGILVRNRVKPREPYAIRRGAPDEPMRLEGPLGQGWHLPALPSNADRTGYRPTRDNWGPLVVPAGQYFVLGDNREDSVDSRYLGFVRRDEILGSVWIIYFSSAGRMRDGISEVFSRADWSRVLKRVH